tara:strand:- start:1029 stop:1772 length:744 start_codon:yes stop_codon:yes gene_type:complete
MRLLLDIGNTHTRAALTSANRLAKTKLFETKEWFNGESAKTINRLVSKKHIDATLCASVVPSATIKVKKFTKKTGIKTHLLTHKNCGLRINYPKPKTIGPDRLANAIGALDKFPPPLIVVDFGTALTFDVVDKNGIYVGGVICPGLSVMTEYLYEKTALLPKVKIKDTSQFIGKSTIEAMQIGAVHGYRGLISNIVMGLKKTLHAKKINVIATGGCAGIISANLPEISATRPFLTLEGLRLASERIN